MLTINLLTFNNAGTIEQTLESVKSLQADIQIMDVGSSDRTIMICKKYQATVHQISTDNLSQARNSLLKHVSDWTLWLEPWEILIHPHKIYDLLKNDQVYSLYVFNRGLISKSIRLWNQKRSLKFKNYIFETVETENVVRPDILIKTVGTGNLDVSQYLTAWEKKYPLSVDLLYYQASHALVEKNWHKFKPLAISFLRKSPAAINVTMMKYYLAQVYFAVDRNYGEAIRLTMDCLLVNPLMAEFWCLLGDLHFELQQINKAKHFYENALLLGSRRTKTDLWPIEISKYKTHPEQLLAGCLEICKSSTIFGKKSM